MVDNNIKQQLCTAEFRREVKDRSDRLMNYFLLTYFLLGLVFASFYDTWMIAVGVGSFSLAAYYSTKFFLPDSNLYQYILSVVLAVFMAQFIYQMHGLFEMHFVAFIGSAILITYQNWKLQIPILILVVTHHAGFGYLQNIGFDNVYFTQLDSLELNTFIIHIVLAGVIFFICGLWAFQLKKYNELHIMQTMEMAKLQKEALISIERKRNEEALEKTNFELRQSNLELDKFVYSVSHDLRAPLTSMLGLIDISEDEVDNPFLAKNLGMLKLSINKLDGFIEDILNYSRNARTEIVVEEIDFNELITGIENNVRYMNRDNRKVEVSVSFKNDTPFYSDRHRLSIIFNNLITNAIRYQNQNVAKPFIDISINTSDVQTVIMIEDNGIGIRKDLQKRVFDMFYRVARNSEGSGLGLYIVKQTIEKLYGRIEIYSEPGVGTSFIMLLPNHPVKQIKNDSKKLELCMTG